jgi:uncharacterized membrane protein SpoIIM required for sporulation
MTPKEVLGLLSAFLAVVSYVPYLRSIFVANTKPHAFTWHITRGDWIAFLTTALAIPLWVATSDPLWSVLLVTGIDAIAYYPTFRKSYSKPDEELAFKYVLTVVRYLLSLMALEHYSVVTSVYQIVSIFMEAGIVVMLLWRRAALGKMAA